MGGSLRFPDTGQVVSLGGRQQKELWESLVLPRSGPSREALVCIFMCVHTCVSVCVRVCMYTYACVHVHICACI